ncbi:MAG TPA: undecaprenyl-diphosphate phosphatase [Mycobacteriales bacterium]|jgi:undecaprenyl-diphosphatase|nr:undecaprenyl-diphosphate phosphatase [Mycobacteriales bacterium]
MSWIEAVILGIVEGLTEFLPVSSTGHVTIVSALFGLDVSSRDITAFTAIIQVGAILAAVVYFFRDIVAMVVGLFRGLVSAEGRQRPEWRLALCVIVGSLPIGVVGLLAKSVIEGPLRNLWVVAVALILWSAVMWAAEKRHRALADQPPVRHCTEVAPKGVRGEDDITVTDAFLIGLAQCFALIPGVSRSGATISAGLFLGLDRVTSTRLAFFLAMPALSAAAVLQSVSARDEITQGVGWTNTLIGIAVSFVVGYAAIAWLLRFVAGHPITVFVWYRVALGVALLLALGAGVLGATSA